jgi:tripartite-type tricarboxylate transporter receptor subunit TctC
MKSFLGIVATIAAFILGVVNSAAAAADYPTRPISVICPVAPGGSHDILGRTFASVAEKYIGQPVTVVNRPGATWMIGTLAVVQAAPDGYTIGLDARSIGSSVEWEIANGRKPPFTRQDLVPIGAFTMSPTLIVVPYNSPWQNLPDLIKDLKAKPNHYAFCSGGSYGWSHIPAELLLRATGTTARHVPYKGGGPCLTAVVAGHVDFSTMFPSGSIPLAQGKKLKILAVQSDRRLKPIPEIPTVRELGIDALGHQWVGLFGPKKIPAPILQKLRETLKKVVDDKSFIDMVEKVGDEVRYTSGEELGRYWENDSEMLSKLFKQLLEEKK